MKRCFILPVKIDSPSQEFYIRRCLKSIRRLYTDSLIVIALAKNTNRITLEYENVIQVENPYFSTLGCIYLFYVNKYADYAYILHDSMIVNKPIIESDKDISFIYSFDEPGMCNEIYADSYRKLLSPTQHYDMIKTQKTGCFGVSMGLHYRAIENIGILPVLAKVTTKNDFCAMERVFAYLCQLGRCEYDVLCGTIFNESDPWVHTELSTMTLDQILERNYTMCVIKSLVGRTE